MPTYVYQCKTCEKQFELEQRITEDSISECLCEKKGAVKRVMQPAAVAFNGSGFYVNDAASCSGTPASCEKCSTEE